MDLKTSFIQNARPFIYCSHLPVYFVCRSNSFHFINYTPKCVSCVRCVFCLSFCMHTKSVYILCILVLCVLSVHCSYAVCVNVCARSFVRSFVYCLNILNMPARLNYTPFISFHPNAFYVFLLKYVHKIARVAARTHNRNTVNPAEPTPVFPNVKFKRFNRME